MQTTITSKTGHELTAEYLPASQDRSEPAVLVTDEGRSVAIYTAKTIRDMQPAKGLDLRGGVPEWQLGPEAVSSLVKFAQQV